MGSWIKNNKFEAFLLLFVVFIGIGAFLHGSGKDSLYEESKEKYSGYARSVGTLRAKKPYPTPEKAKAFEEQVDDYEKTVLELQSKMLAFRPKGLDSISPPKFIENLNAVRAEVTAAMTASGVEYPDDDFYVGFKSYTGVLPKEEATSHLNYQLSAMKALFGVLAEAKPSALLNVHRAKLAVEETKSPDPVERGRGGRRPGRAASQKEPPFERLPVEVSFVSSEPVMRKILADLASHPDYYFVVRSMRIQNEKRTQGPAKDDVEFDTPEEEAPTDDPFPDFEDNLPADDGIAEDPADAGDAFPAEPTAVAGIAADKGSRVLGQILGAEQINVLLEIDIILFKAAEKAEEQEPKRS